MKPAHYIVNNLNYLIENKLPELQIGVELCHASLASGRDDVETAEDVLGKINELEMLLVLIRLELKTFLRCLIPPINYPVMPYPRLIDDAWEAGMLAVIGYVTANCSAEIARSINFNGTKGKKLDLAILQIVLCNMLDNAVRSIELKQEKEAATPIDLLWRGRISVHLFSEGSKFVMEIADNGIGVAGSENLRLDILHGRQRFFAGGNGTGMRVIRMLGSLLPDASLELGGEAPEDGGAIFRFTCTF